jgi:hypothetical protein
LTKKAVSSGWFLHSSNHHIPGANGTVDQAAKILNVLAITKPHPKRPCRAELRRLAEHRSILKTAARTCAGETDKILRD